MKIDNNEFKALISLAALAYEDVNEPAQEIGKFVNAIVIPLLTKRKNSQAYKDAQEALLSRGRNARALLKKEEAR
jgi:hypothetical protein